VGLFVGVNGGRDFLLRARSINEKECIPTRITKLKKKERERERERSVGFLILEISLQQTIIFPN
jgi:hypothetical protein